MEKEQAVRAAAAALKAAIVEAQAAGYRVVWPARAEDLDGIAISETARVQQASAPLPEPARPAPTGRTRK